MTHVYIVQHVHETDDGAEDVKLIGVYSSRETAEAATSRLSKEPGFRDDPSGFHIDEYQVDRDHWAEGFSTAETERRAAV
jgi:hypothetical protein